MVSFIDILRKLMEGTYSTMTGSPDAPETFREFVEEIKVKVPELRDKDDWEVENTVLEAIDYARHKLCSQIKKAEVVPATPDYYGGITVYTCYHPDIGRFYLVIDEEEDASSGYAHYSFTITKNRRKALREYEERIKAWKEEEVEFEETI
ncbi:MAG: hypothetical protein DRJ40_11405 [Thermoprotei archaeon]|nr:MAG: hypothetical protein DRJ40_11405 [Thermoprotei archaeon]